MTRKQRTVPDAPGRRDMAMSEAFERVVRMANRGFKRGVEEKRDAAAISLIEALGIGSFNAGK